MMMKGMMILTMMGEMKGQCTDEVGGLWFRSSLHACMQEGAVSHLE
jgi:hypothetical protein